MIHEECRNRLARRKRLRRNQPASGRKPSRVHACQASHHSLGRTSAPDLQQTEQTCARNDQIGLDLDEIDAVLQDLQERRVAAGSTFEELDLALAEAQEQYARHEEAVLNTERKLNAHREQQRAGTPGPETAFARRAAAGAHERIAARLRLHNSSCRRWRRSRRRAARIWRYSLQRQLRMACRKRLRKLEREQHLAAQRSNYEDLTSVRAGDERRLGLERELEPLRSRITEWQLKEQAARIGVEQYAQSLAEAGVDEAALEQSITDEGVKLSGLQVKLTASSVKLLHWAP